MPETTRPAPATGDGASLAHDQDLPIHLLFDRQCAAGPQRVAVRDPHRELTYAQLSTRADRLAAVLRQACPVPGRRIGLHLNRGTEVVVAMLAVLRAGHTYVPLDPGYPAERLLFTARDTDLSLVVSDQPVPEALRGIQVVRVDAGPWADGPAPADHASVDDPGLPAYIIHTSGSTGVPKGVVVPHRNVVALVRACRRRFALDRDDVWTLFHSYAFDFSVWEIWGALLTGGTLVVVPKDVASSPLETLDLLARERVTVFNVVPSVFRYLARLAALRPDTAFTLRYVVFGGESVDVRDVRAWRSAYGRSTRFVNTYGITETTVFVTTRPFTDEELDRPAGAPGEAGFALDLGTPLDGWRMRVVGDDGADIRPGETGEILVAGAGVASGYHDRPQATAERFPLLPAPDGRERRHYRSGDLARMLSDGTLCYAGRADDQVKINGFRIELGEVETQLRGTPGVRDLVVVRTFSQLDEPVLTAFYTVAHDAHTSLAPEGTDGAREGQPVANTGGTPHDLAAHARRVLPAHLVPSRFVPLTALPVNQSGKTDRRALSQWSPQGR
ncbi:amino acid adenylation domain-containing protein [Streptomyces syringium]|uniref:amino acid adenylation domain-containing protein n=1 Tax=Streptomyces syringium TaxID=76729 RepID=UPI00341F4A1E